MTGTAAQLPMPFALPKQNTFERFVVGANAELVQRLQRRSDGFDCLWLFGPGGVGKTHLLQAACSKWRGASYIPARGIDASTTSLDAYSWCDVLAVDDVPWWLGNRESEVATLALYNKLSRNGAMLVFAADRSPREVECVLPDLRSRLCAASCYRIAPLADDDKLQMLAEEALRRGLLLGDDVLQFLLARASRGQRDLMRVLDRLDHASLAQHRRITIPFVKAVLCL